MKGLLIGGGIVLALILGFFPGGISRPKPVWWRWLTALAMIVTVVMALGIPTGGDFASFTTVTMSRNDELPLPVYGSVAEKPAASTVLLEDVRGNREPVDISGIAGFAPQAGEKMILAVSFKRSERRYVASRVISENPIAVLPLIPGLEERARNLYFHVPSAWLAQLAWFIAFGFAVMYLRKRRPEDDVRAAAAAGLGAVFCILATVTGAVWAKFNWGMFWNWDPRQTSIFVVLVIYGAYFALRSALPNEDQRSRVSAVYLILLMVPVIFFLFIFPRLVDGLHPGAADSGNAGPVISADEDALNPMKQVIFALSMFSFTMLFFWMLNVNVRAGLAALRSRRRSAERQELEERGVPAGVAMDSEVVRLR